MEDPYIQVTDTGAIVILRPDITTIGRGSHVDIRLADPSVSLLHAEIIRRGPYTYVSDLGLSRNGTRVNGRLVARRVLCDGDALAFGSARCKIAGIEADELAETEVARSSAPELTRRELDVITSLCRPAMSDDAFVTPATAREIAADLVVTEAAVKQHLLRLYSKLRISEGQNRRIRLANEVVALGLARPQLPDDQRGAQAMAGQGAPISPISPAPKQTVPRQTAPRQTVPRQATPSPAVTKQTIPRQTAPSQAAPVLASPPRPAGSVPPTRRQAAPDQASRTGLTGRTGEPA